MTLDINKIKAAALAATQNFKSGCYSTSTLYGITANPSAVLELIAQLEATQADSERFFNLYMDYKEKLEAAEEVITGHVNNALEFQKRNADLNTKLEAAERDAACFQYLQNIDKVEAQSFFWTYSSRKQRKQAINLAMKESK